MHISVLNLSSENNHITYSWLDAAIAKNFALQATSQFMWIFILKKVLI